MITAKINDVHLQYVDSVLLKVRTEPGILMELSEEFTYFAQGYKFSPKFRNRMWDGKIRLINSMTGLCYAGLAKRIKKFCIIPLSIIYLIILLLMFSFIIII